MKKLSLWVLVFLFCALPVVAETSGDGANESQTVLTVEKVRYDFEHRLLPTYFYDQPQAMLDAIERAGVFELWDSICAENGVAHRYTQEDYAEHWYKANDNTTIVQIEMPKPEANVLCDRVYFVYNPETGKADYLTVEYDNLFGEMYLLCGWTKEHTHVNYDIMVTLDKSADDYAAALLAEAEQVAELAGASSTLSPIDALPSSADAPRFDEPSDVILSLISCPELGFTTMANAAYTWAYEEGTGVYIYTEHEGSIPYALIWQSEDLIEDPLEYIKEQYTPHMQQQYGDDLVNFVEYEAYDIGGKSLPAGLYTYKLQGHLIDMLRLYDSTGSRTVAYSAKYIQGEGNKTLAALDTAIRHFQSDSTSAIPTPTDVPTFDEAEDDLIVVSCPEKGFSTMVDSSCEWKNDGIYLTIYTENDNHSSYVDITDSYISDPYKYIKEKWTPHMQANYDLVDYAEYEAYDIGGQQLPAALYTYNKYGEVIDSMQLYYRIDDLTFSFTAKYIHGAGEATLATLDAAIRHFKAEPVSKAPDQSDSTGYDRADAGKLISVSCPEEGFSTKINSYCTWRYDPYRGIVINIGAEEGIPVVTIQTRSSKLDHPYEYIQNEWTPSMLDLYGDNFVDDQEYAAYDIGSKQLPAALYRYTLDEDLISDLWLYDTIGEHTIVYNAKYTQEQSTPTLTVLDTALRNFKVDATKKKDILTPMMIDSGTIDTQGGTYWVDITDTDRIENGGYFTASLYLQARYAVSGIEGLEVGDQVQVDDQVLTVSALQQVGGGDVEMIPKERFDGRITFTNEGSYYQVTVDDWMPLTFVTDYKVMLPLPNDFSYVEIDSAGAGSVYDWESFISLLESSGAPTLASYNTLLNFQDDLIMMIVHTVE